MDFGKTSEPVSESKSWKTTVTKVDSWPEEAKPLGKSTSWVSWLYVLGDFILVVLPICFLALGVAAITLHGKPVEVVENGSKLVQNEFGKKVEAAIQLGPTIFPIVFAAISGRSMKMIARYLAERGAKLGVITTLFNCMSYRTNTFADPGTAHGQPVSLGDSGKPDFDAAFDCGWSQLTLPLVSVSAWRPGISASTRKTY